MTSTKVSSPRARAREDSTLGDQRADRRWLLPPGRDPQAEGRCVFPGCVTDCEKYVPACAQHWKNAPQLFTRAIRDGWRAKDARRWLLAIEALRMYWHAVAP